MRRALSTVIGRFAVALAVGLAVVGPARAGEDTAEWWRPNDAFLRPKPAGTRLKLFGFWGPGARATLETHAPLEGEMSELHTQVLGDVNFGFAEASALADIRVFLLSFGVGAGYRHDWRHFKFEPDANGLDHGSRVLDRDTRVAKDDDVDFETKGIPWVELRSRFVLPGARFMPVIEGAYRYEDRPDESFDWAMATVFNGGWHLRAEGFLFYRHFDFGFVGPAVRLLVLPRTNEAREEAKELEVHYGFVFGTSPGWSSGDHELLVRVYTAFGTDEKNVMGAHTYGAPLQIIAGYQAEVEF